MKPDIQGRSDIRTLVDSFYTSAASDSLLGEIFERLEHSADREHLYLFWESALLHASPGKSDEFPPHIESLFSARHFIRWLNLFLESIDRLYSGPNAEKAKVIVIRKSEEFQASLEISLF